MSFQDTNLVAGVEPTFVGLDNFAKVLNDPLFGIAVRNTAYFALLALVIGFPIPLILAVVMSELRRRRGLLSALAYLPVVIPPVVAVLLWKVFYNPRPTGVFNTILGWFGLGSGALAPVGRDCHARARGRGDLGRGGWDDHHLSGRAT